MNPPNGNAADRLGVVDRLELTEDLQNSSNATNPPPSPELPTRTKQRARQQFQENRYVVVGAGALVIALLIFVAVSMPRSRTAMKESTHKSAVGEQTKPDRGDGGVDKSLLPITDSGRAVPKESQNGFLNERDLERTVKRAAPRTQTTLPTGPGTLGSIPPFGDQNWQAPPYQLAATVATDPDKSEHDALEKPSLIYVRKSSPMPSIEAQTVGRAEPQFGLGLAAGTKLRARLESAVSTAVHTPVLAVIEYNYERYGEIVVPAGAKAVGHIREANRSGYVDIEFETLLIPDGTSLPIQAAATGLDLRPIKGRVEGKNTGKNILVRSLSGIGQAGSMLVGQNSLNQPLSESDLIRERVSSNIGEAGDEEVSRLAVNQRIVVTVSAGTPIYVVLEQSPKSTRLPELAPTRTSPEASTSLDDLHQLMQLKRELSPVDSEQSRR